jgi:hypothetical protein
MTVAVTEAVRERLDRVRRERAGVWQIACWRSAKIARRISRSPSVQSITVTCFMMRAGCRDDHRHIGADRDPSSKRLPKCRRG